MSRLVLCCMMLAVVAIWGWTFVLVKEYPARVPIHHVDLYRLQAPQVELTELGIEEMLADGVVLIEWANRAENTLPRPRWDLEITLTGEHARRLHLRRID